MTIALSLNWVRCLDGVHIVDLGEEPPKRERAVQLGLPDHGRWIKPRSQSKVVLQSSSVDLADPLVVRFINAASEEDLVKFISRFGPRTQHAVEGGSDLKTEFAARRQFEKQLAGALSDDPAVSAATVRGLLEGVTLIPSFEMSDPTAPAISLNAPSQHAFMCMEIATAAANGAKLARCENCGTAFLTGPLTGRRSHAKFCSDRCRVAAMRKRNAEAK